MPKAVVGHRRCRRLLSPHLAAALRAALASHPALDGDVVAGARRLGTVAQTSAQLEATWRLFTAMGRSQLALLETFTGMPVEYWRRMENASWRVWAASRLDDGKTRGRSKSFQTLLKPAAPAAPASLGHAILRGRDRVAQFSGAILRRNSPCLLHHTGSPRRRCAPSSSAASPPRAATAATASAAVRRRGPSCAPPADSWRRRPRPLGGYADEEAEARQRRRRGRRDSSRPCALRDVGRRRTSPPPAPPPAHRRAPSPRASSSQAALSMGELLDTEIDRLTGGGGARRPAASGGGGGALRTPILLRRQNSQPVVFPAASRPTSGEALPVDLDGAPVARRPATARPRASAGRRCEAAGAATSAVPPPPSRRPCTLRSRCRSAAAASPASSRARWCTRWTR